MSQLSNGKTVLLVEDDEWLRWIVAELLEDEGYRVVEAGTGPEALLRVVEEPPHAIVLDMRLPLMSGLTVLRTLRSRDDTNDVPVVVMSGHVGATERAQLQRRPLQAQSVIEKPLDVGRLIDELERATWS